MKIHSILIERYGTGGNLSKDFPEWGAFSGPKLPAPSPENVAASLMAEVELGALSESELDAEYKRSQLEALAKLEAKRWYNQPGARADFSHWAKCAYWRIPEAVALILGRDPGVINATSLKPVEKHVQLSKDFHQILDLANRAVSFNQLSEFPLPGAFIVWAKRYDISVPEELEKAVASYGHLIRDWKTLCDEAQSKLTQALARETAAITAAAAAQMTLSIQKSQLENLKAQVAALQSGSADKAVVRPGADVRELESLRKLSIAMAIKGYRYDPAERRSDKIAEIVGELELLGIPLSRETVRRHLKEGAALLSPEALAKDRD